MYTKDSALRAFFLISGGSQKCPLFADRHEVVLRPGLLLRCALSVTASQSHCPPGGGGANSSIHTTHHNTSTHQHIIPRFTSQHINTAQYRIICLSSPLQSREVSSIAKGVFELSLVHRSMTRIFISKVAEGCKVILSPFCFFLNPIQTLLLSECEFCFFFV